jgi:Methyltransferase domain
VPATDIGSEPAIPRLPDWLDALEVRHLADLRFADVTRALRALSAAYVQRRSASLHRALDGAGKRAAFAMFYGPLHLLLVHAIVRRLPGAADARHIADLGCGSGVAGAAWALAGSGRARVTGIDAHPWALQEAAWTYRAFDIDGHIQRAGVDQARFGSSDAIVAAFVVNEIGDAPRARLLPRLLHASARGARADRRADRHEPASVVAGVAARLRSCRRPRRRVALPSPPPRPGQAPGQGCRLAP